MRGIIWGYIGGDLELYNGGMRGLYGVIWGYYEDQGPMMENHMENKLEIEVETRLI